MRTILATGNVLLDSRSGVDAVRKKAEKALRDGQSPKALKGLASSDFTSRVTGDANVNARSAEFLGLKG